MNELPRRPYESPRARPDRVFKPAPPIRRAATRELQDDLIVTLLKDGEPGWRVAGALRMTERTLRNRLKGLAT